MTDSPTVPVLALDEIRAAADNPAVDLDVPEWGGRVKVRGFTRAEALQWANTSGENDDGQQGNVLCLHFGLVDPAVTREEAQELVETKSQRAVARVAAEVMRLSGLGATFQDPGTVD